MKVKPSHHFEMIAKEKLERDLNQPRSTENINEDRSRLRSSISQIGIQQALLVRDLDNGTYKILDGHRRYECAKELNISNLPCLVLKNYTAGQLELIRYEVQNNKRAWKPVEKANSFSAIQRELSLSDEQLAAHLGISVTQVRTSLRLREYNQDMIKLIVSYDLNESAQDEFSRVLPKIRKINEIETKEITEIIFRKLQTKVISNAKDLRKLGRIFLKAQQYEASLYEFLTDPDMQIATLEKRIVGAIIPNLVSKISEILAEKRSNRIKLTEDGLLSCKELLVLVPDLIKSFE